MKNHRTCYHAASPKDRRPVRAAYRPRPMSLGDFVDAQYLAGRMTLSEARQLLPGFIPEYALASDLDEVLALMGDDG